MSVLADVEQGEKFRTFLRIKNLSLSFERVEFFPERDDVFLHPRYRLPKGLVAQVAGNGHPADTFFQDQAVYGMRQATVETYEHRGTLARKRSFLVQILPVRQLFELFVEHVARYFGLHLQDQPDQFVAFGQV